MKTPPLRCFALLLCVLSLVGVQPAVAGNGFPPDSVPYRLPQGEGDIISGLPVKTTDVLPLDVGPMTVSDYGYSVAVKNLTESQWDGEWIDADQSTDCIHSTILDGTGSGVEELDLKFSFPFFEKTYSKISLSTQGLLLFDWTADLGVPKIHNEPISHQATPNAFIAAFWYDLGFYADKRPGAGVYFCSYDDKLVVLWNQGDIALSADTGRERGVYTFEAILKPDGSITILYNMEGDLGAVSQGTGFGTIGIEDARGWSGDQRLFNAPFYDGLGVSEGKVKISYQRPGGAGTRFSVWPANQGQFVKVVSGKYQPAEFKVGLVNFNSIAQTYQLAVTKPADTWSVEIRNTPGGAPITNNLLENVPAGQQMDFYVRLIPPDLSLNRTAFGANTRVKLEIKDHPGGSNVREVNFAAAVPAPFAQGYWDNNNATTHFSLYSGAGLRDWSVTGAQNSAVFSVENRSLGYVYTWTEERVISTNLVKEIKYTFLDSGGSPIWPAPQSSVRTLVSYPNPAQFIWDEQVVAAGSNNGEVGIAWRNRTGPDRNTFTHNVKFAVLDYQGNLAAGPVNLTQNDVPMFITFRDIRISALGDTRYVVAWTQRETHFVPNQVDSWDVYFTIVDNQGKVVKPITKVTQDQIGGRDQYYFPALQPLANGQFILAWNKNDTAGYYYIQYAAFNATGQIVKPVSHAHVSNQALVAGWLDIAQFNQGGKIVIASPYYSIHLIYLDPVTLNPVGPVVDLENPASLTYDQRFASLAATTDNRMVVTWGNYHYAADLDRDGVTPFLTQLYYALVDSTGAVVTQPMIFVSSKDTEDPFLNLNQIGYANSRFPMIMGEVDLEVFSSPQVNATRNTTTQIEAQYINYGDVPAGNVTLKATLANGVTFVSANPAPSVSNPAMREYTWTLQPNPMVYPNSGSVKLFVKSLTVGNYPITWQISYAGSESDMHNNMEVVTLSIIDRKVYLPTIRR